VVKVLDHDVLGKVEVADYKLVTAEGTIGSNDLVIRILFVDVVCHVGEPDLA